LARPVPRQGGLLAHGRALGLRPAGPAPPRDRRGDPRRPDRAGPCARPSRDDRGYLRRPGAEPGSPQAQGVPRGRPPPAGRTQIRPVARPGYHGAPARMTDDLPKAAQPQPDALIVSPEAACDLVSEHGGEIVIMDD